MRTASRRRTMLGFRPHLLPLEERLPLGDGVLGLLVGAALLPPRAAPAAVQPVPQSSGAPVVGRISNPSAWPDGLEIRATAQALADAPPAALAAPDWASLTDPFAAATRRRPETLVPSPQRQQGHDVRPLLALRAGEDRGTAHVFAAPPARAAATPDAETVLLATLAGSRAHEAHSPAAVAPAQAAQVQQSFDQLPLYFEQNVGQTDASVHYFARGPGYGLFLTSTEAVMVLQQPTKAAVDVGGGKLSRPCLGASPVPDCLGRESMAPAATAQDAPEPPAVVRLQLVGANATPAVTGRDQQPGKINYFLGNDPAQWHTNIATFGRVEYDDVYPGIDLVWHGSQNQLEYDFVVAPGADPSVIRLNVSGAEHTEIDAAGDLLIHAGEPGGVSPGITLRQHKPFVYQTVGSGRQEVASRFVLEGRQVRFQVGAYDAARPLVIDPVLSYSTFLGGSSWENGSGIAVDPNTGDALVTGSTNSTNFPTANPLQGTYGGGLDDVFVTRLNAAGSALVFSTYLGGNSSDYGDALAVDPASGDVLVTGSTDSTNFPTANPLQASNRGFQDVFVARLSASGSALVFSTYLGGSGGDYGRGIAVDPTTGDAFITGQTTSTNFPTANPLQRTYGGGSGDAFVTRLNAAGSALVFSTYLGGSIRDEGRDIAVDPASGDALVTGGTSSSNFPTANPLQAVNRGGYDVFVTRLSASGSALVFSTYLGGSSADLGIGIAVDPASGDALVTGHTLSTNFPTANPLQATYGGGINDVFVARLNAAGSALVFSTYLGGNSSDWGDALAVDPATGDALVTGFTASNNFPTANPFQPTHGGGRDTFVARIGSSPVAYYYVYPDSGQVTAGVPLDLYVFALDAQFRVIEDYTGLILFYATDPLATTPVYYQYQRTDRGVAYFPGGLTFNTPGLQELYVFDWPAVQVFGYAAFDVRP